MAIIKTQTPEAATGLTKTIFDGMMHTWGMVPKPMMMMSSSEGLLEAMTGVMKYYGEHPTLSPLLLAHIRMCVAFQNKYPYCIELNGRALKMMGGLTDEQVAAIRQDPQATTLPKKEKDLLLFVIKAIEEPQNVQADDMQHLRDLGWSDSDIYDATNHGVLMVSNGILFNIFKMQEDGSSC
jgi:hypothetical protein